MCAARENNYNVFTSIYNLAYLHYGRQRHVREEPLTNCSVPRVVCPVCPTKGESANNGERESANNRKRVRITLVFELTEPDTETKDSKLRTDLAAPIPRHNGVRDRGVMAGKRRSD